MRTAAGTVATGALYWAGFSYRTDYAGHFLAGLGATLALVACISLIHPQPHGWLTVMALVVAVLIGAGAEFTVFRLAIFDPVDFCNQSLGACVATAAVIGRRVSIPAALLLGTLGGAATLAGFYLAFA